MINIDKIRQKVEKQRNLILSKIRRLRKDDPFANEDRSIIEEPGTDAQTLFSHEQVAVFEGKLKSDLKEIEKALSKIKKGTYGICDNCGKKIDPKRLEVKPQAIYCLSCEKKLESKGNY